MQWLSSVMLEAAAGLFRPKKGFMVKHLRTEAGTLQTIHRGDGSAARAAEQRGVPRPPPQRGTGKRVEHFFQR